MSESTRRDTETAGTLQMNHCSTSVQGGQTFNSRTSVVGILLGVGVHEAVVGLPRGTNHGRGSVPIWLECVVGRGIIQETDQACVEQFLYFETFG